VFGKGRAMRGAAILLLLLLCTCAIAQEPCKFEAGGEKAAACLENALKRAPTCGKAAELLRKWMWGSSADVGFASIVIQKCEKTLLPRLAATGKARYKWELEMCAYEYAGQDGTLYRSEAAMCAVDVVTRFASEPALAEQRAPRASFDCVKPKTSLEKAICSDEKLGRADIVLQRAYRPVLLGLSASERPLLIRQQKNWRISVEKECGASTAPLDDAARVCVQKEFEARFMELDSCSVGGPEECLREDSSNKP
jgi:uncharacterized protein YecT (DUF1311 family)